jgi:hypothetical protein
VAELDDGVLDARRHRLDSAASEARAALRRLQRLGDRVAELEQAHLAGPAKEAEEAVQRLLELLEQARVEQRQLLKRQLRGEDGEQ